MNRFLNIFRTYRFTIILLIIGLCLWIGYPRLTTYQGETMGTTYSIKVFRPFWISQKKLHQDIQTRLKEINQSLSTYISNSDISRFNMLDSSKPMPIPIDFYRVLKDAYLIYDWSQGAWDPTLLPLIELWGFGKEKPKLAPPSQLKIRTALNQIGFSQIKLSENPLSLFKDKPHLSIDLSSIAKGYGVDVISDLFKSKNIKHYFIEIGGEIRVSGKSGRNNYWKIGINVPSTSSSRSDVIKILTLKNVSVATSGSYRQYFDYNGKQYSHIIDPRTGYPVDSGIVSVTVIGPTCSIADGLATALMVMSVREGIALLNRLPDIDGLIYQTTPTGLKSYRSDNFNQYVSQQ